MICAARHLPPCFNSQILESAIDVRIVSDLLRVIYIQYQFPIVRVAVWYCVVGYSNLTDHLFDLYYFFPPLLLSHFRTWDLRNTWCRYNRRSRRKDRDRNCWEWLSFWLRLRLQIGFRFLCCVRFLLRRWRVRSEVQLNFHIDVSNSEISQHLINAVNSKDHLGSIVIEIGRNNLDPWKVA